MRRSKHGPVRVGQQISEELRGFCLSFLQRKFYTGRDREFTKQRQDLLRWVVLWPAQWFDRRGVTIAPDQYREIFEKVFMDSIRFGDIENIQYPPAWLAKVIQSHFHIHGEDYYEAAKSVRTMTENALLYAQKHPTQAPDPVRELAQAARLIKPRNHGKRKAVLDQKKDQLTLL